MHAIGAKGMFTLEDGESTEEIIRREKDPKGI